ncbi:hypothetical protein WN944_005912 [Citrus x changshan-huyou]|uniref:Uncharacterized protein n=1 Tax=Citrus x changshan-huyou TaxID=2935761 RepID=A0AAP0MI83_9ROSI
MLYLNYSPHCCCDLRYQNYFFWQCAVCTSNVTAYSGFSVYNILLQLDSPLQGNEVGFNIFYGHFCNLI